MDFSIHDDVLVRFDRPIFDRYGNVVGAQQNIVITKEEFIACYKEWILEEKKDELGHA